MSPRLIEKRNPKGTSTRNKDLHEARLTYITHKTMTETTTDKRPYRATFILDTRNVQESVEELVEKLANTIGDIGGEVKKVDNQGQKEFVRVTDRDFPAGVYVLIDFEGPPAAPQQLQEKLRLDRTVYRIVVQGRS